MQGFHYNDDLKLGDEYQQQIISADLLIDYTQQKQCVL